MIQFILNNQTIQTDQASGMTVLDFVRYQKHLTGTKIGCREGDCGACTLLVGKLESNGQVKYQSMTSCLMPLGNAQGKHIVSIEGLNMKKLSPVQQAIVDEGGTQCGFCTVGFVVSLAGFTLSQQPATYQNAIAAIDGNICRCTGYKSLERAAETVTQQLQNKDADQPIEWLIENGFLPTYFKNIPERLEALNEAIYFSTEQPDAIFVGGGTDLFVQRPEEMAEADIQHVFDQETLKGIVRQGEYCHIAAASTATDLQESPVMQAIFPRLREHIKLVSSTPIRNMGTLAGNFVNASPIGDLTIFFLALDSSIVLSGGRKKRRLKLRDFYKGYKKMDKAADEFIENIFFKIPSENALFNFEKVCKRTHLDIATVNAACLLEMKGNTIQKAHLSVGGVGPTPIYLKKTAQFLENKTVSPTVVKKAAKVMQTEISPISDVRGSANYKRLLARQFLFAHFLQHFKEKMSLQQLVG